LIIPGGRDCGSAFSSQVALSPTCALIALGEGEPTRVLAHGAKKRCTVPVWSALVFPFLTYCSGNGGAKFSKKIGFLPALRMEAPAHCDADNRRAISRSPLKLGLSSY